MKDALNINSLMLAVSLSAIGWVGYETGQAGKMLSAISVTIGVNSKLIFDLQSKLESTISRREYDARVMAIEVRLREIDVQMYNLKSNTGPPK